MARVDGLHAQRAAQVIEQLVEATLAGKTRWERGERRDVFVYKGGGGVVEVSGPPDPLTPNPNEHYAIRFLDPRGQQIFWTSMSAVEAANTVDDSYLYQRLRRLWMLVAESGDPAIQVMDSLIQELRD